MAETGKRPMPDNASSQASKKRKGGAGKWKQQSKNSIETGDCGVFITCDIGKEGKCIPEAIDLFSQRVEEPANAGGEDSSADEEEDIEAQIRKEVEGMKPGSGSKTPLFRPVRLDITCVSFIRFDKSLDPEKIVHDICVDAYNNPDRKQTRFLQRMTPARSIRKTLSVDLEVFAKEILKPHFHSGGPPRKYAIRPNVKGGSKLKRDEIIQTVARCVGPGHSVDLKNYDLVILVDVVQNVIGMSVAGSDYEKLKRYNLAELYKPSAKPEPSKTAESKDEAPAAA